VWKNLWLSLGCNAKGFDAPDLAGEAYTQRGVYLHLNFKFDESLFGGSPLAARAAPVHSAAGRQP
jgi:acyl transferase domain-containing protein